MKKEWLRSALFIGIPYLFCGVYFVLAGVTHGQSNVEPRTWDFGDSANLLIGGLPGGIIGAVIERLSRKKK